MASGYEKDACGVDPNEGWGKPTRRDRWVSRLYLGVVMGFVLGGMATALWRVLAGGD